MKFPNKIKIHPRYTEDLTGKGKNTIIRCFVETGYVESSKKKSALLAEEVMKRWNMHDELVLMLSVAQSAMPSNSSYHERIDKILKLSEQK